MTHLDIPHSQLQDPVEENLRAFPLLKLGTVFWVGFFTVLGFGIRLWNLDGDSFWIDEFYTLMVAGGHLHPPEPMNIIRSAQEWFVFGTAWQPLSWELLLTALKENVHMPLYYWLLNPWLEWTGISEWNLRMFSVLWSTAMVPLVYGFGRRLTDKPAIGLLAAGLMALTPFQIYYGQEGRMYAMAMALGLASTWMMWEWVHSKTNGWQWPALYTVFTTAGMMTHYNFSFILLFHGCFLLFSLRNSHTLSLNPNFWVWFPLPIVAWSILAWTWAPVFMAQRDGYDSAGHFTEGLFPPIRYIGALIWNPYVYLTGENKVFKYMFIPMVFLGVGRFLVSSLLWLMGKENRARCVLLLLWSSVPTLGLIVLDHIQGTHMTNVTRYGMIMAPASVMVLAWGLWTLWEDLKDRHPRWALAGLGFVTLTMAVAAFNTVDYDSEIRYQERSELRRAASFMANQTRPGDLVVVNGDWGAQFAISYYLKAFLPNQPVLYWAKKYQHNTNLPLPEMATFKPYPRVWYLKFHTDKRFGHQELQDYLGTLYHHNVRMRGSGEKLWLYSGQAFEQ